jgi:acid phosphatase type 7
MVRFKRRLRTQAANSRNPRGRLRPAAVVGGRTLAAVAIAVFVALVGTARAEGWYTSHSDLATRTLALSTATDPVVAAVGDMACDPLAPEFNGGNGTSLNCHQDAVRSLLSAIKPVALLGLGDMQYEDGQYGKYVGGVVNGTTVKPCPNNVATCVVPASYDPSFGSLKAVTYPTPGGGHDANGASGYYRYFGANAGPNANTTWYSLNIGSWHIVSLNANCPQVSGHLGVNECAAGSEQETWLKNDLAASNKPCSIMFVHYPRWNAGEFADNTTYLPLLQDFYNAGGDLLLAGHDHDYQRYAPQDPNGNRDPAKGVTEIVVGTGGKNHNPSQYPLDTTHANLLVSNMDTFGVLKLTLHEGSYDFAFVPEVGKTFTDAGQDIPCHNTTDAPPDTPPTAPQNVTATAAGTTVTVRWTASSDTDQTRVAGYKVYRNGVQIAQLGATVLTYNDSNLASGTTFAYTVRAFDSGGNQSILSASASAQTAAANRAPSAADVAFSAQTGVAASWLPSVSDPDGDALTCSIGTPPAHGAASVSADCSHGSYTATPGYVGSDPFTYTVSDGSLSATANAAVTVAAPPPNRPPSGAAAGVSTMQRVAVTVPLAATDPDGNCPLTFVPAHPGRGSLGVVGNVSCSNGNATAQVTYTPNAPVVGTDSFTYTVRDPAGATSTPISRTITVRQSQPPVASAEVATTLQHTPVTISLAASDPNGECPLVFTPTAASRGPLSAVTNVSCSNGSASAQVTYTPNPPVLGADSFSYTVRNPSGVSSAAAKVAITIVAAPPSRPPVASSVSVSTMQHVPVVVPLAAVDPDGSCPLMFTPTAPSRGALSAVANLSCANGSATAQITYTPNAPLVGSDSFTFTARDPSGATSAVATVSITVRASKAPVASTAAASTFQRIPVVVSLAATDPDGECPLSFTPSAPGRGSVSTVTNVSCSNGNATAQVTYRPNPPVVGSDAFSYTVHDPSGAVSAAAVATISIAPTLFSDSFETATLGSWTTFAGLAIESGVVAGGSYAVEANTSNGRAWAKRILPSTYPELTYRIRFRLHTRPAGLPVTLLSFRTAADSPIADVFVDGSGRLGLRNDITGVTTTSTATVTLDTWHFLAVHLKINGAAGVDNVTLDTAAIAALSSSAVNLGPSPVAGLQIGEPAPGMAFDAFFDDIYATSP